MFTGYVQEGRTPGRSQETTQLIRIGPWLVFGLRGLIQVPSRDDLCNLYINPVLQMNNRLPRVN